MTKRYYYTCPIKALYMMKEFNVKFVDEVGYNFEDWRVDRDGINVITDLTRLFTTYPRVYVAKESEGIFNIKAGDFVTNSFKQYQSRHCHGFACHPNGLSDTSIAITTPERHNGKTYFVEDISELSIIMRDNKQFFMPEVEND